MPVLPLARNAYQRSTGLVPEVQCRNFYLEKDGSGISPDGTIRIQRPGQEIIRTIANPTRALTIDPSDGSVYAIGNTNLYRNNTDLGSISAPASGYGRIVVTQLVTAALSSTTILTDEVALWDGATITVATVPGGTGIIDIDQLNGYILALDYKGVFHWLVPGELVFDPLNFATAESSPDTALAIRQIGEEFWIFGSRTVEPWQPTGNADLPFERAAGRTIPHGCLAGNTVQRFDNTIVWVGDDCNVYRGGGVATVISTPAIAERIRKRSLSQEMSAFVFTLDGHSFYSLRIPFQGTFLYDAATQEWCQWQTEGADLWTPAMGDSYSGQTFVAGVAQPYIWRLSAALLLDDGQPFTRLVTASVPITGVPPRNDSLSIGIGASDDTTVRIRWRDGQDDYPADYYETLDVRAPYDICSLYRLGAPVPPYREFEISFTGPEQVRIAGCMANEAWQ